VRIEDLPKGVYMEWREGFFVAVNYTDDSFYFPVGEKSRIILGSNPLKSASAIIWQTE
jgi:beta-galactosidase